MNERLNVRLENPISIFFWSFAMILTRIRRRLLAPIAHRFSGRRRGRGVFAVAHELIAVLSGAR